MQYFLKQRYSDKKNEVFQEVIGNLNLLHSDIWIFNMILRVGVLLAMYVVHLSRIFYILC